MRFRLLAISAISAISMTFLAFACGGLTAAPNTDDALAFYDAGRFAEARFLLEELDDRAGLDDGALLYRLAYCQRSTGATDKARETEERARVRLEKVLPGTAGLEIPFYLVNTYGNLGRAEDAQRLAAETTARLEKGEFGKDLPALDAFRVGKLYSDQNRQDAAAEWFEQALGNNGASEKGDPLSDTYAQWAARFLADRANGKGDTAGFERSYTRYLEAGGQATAAELERIAVTRARQQRYEDAAEAWEAALRNQPPDTNRVRYSAALARTAARLHPLPETDAAGRPWVELSKEELETLMKEEAQRARDLLVEAREIDKLKGKERAHFRAGLRDARVVFVTAAMEYTLRGNPIRETAFFGGYAPMILSNSAWRLPGKEKPIQIVD